MSEEKIAPVLKLVQSEKPNDVLVALDHALAQSGQFDSVVVLALKRDGGDPWIRTSTSPFQDKAVMLSFFQAWCNDYWGLCDH